MTMCMNCQVVVGLHSHQEQHYSILPSIILMSVFIDRGRESPFLKVIGRMFLNLLNGNRSGIQV